MENNMCPIYEYKNEKTGEIIEEFRSIENRNIPIVLADGTICKRLEVSTSFNGWKKNKEVFEADREYVRKCKPKYVKFRDGHREIYNPTKHN